MDSKWRFYEDPTHGWLEVHKDEILEVGIENDITSCSYVNGDYVYLEEDYDIGLFLSKKGYKRLPREIVEEVYTNTISVVTSYKPYHSSLIK